MRIFKYFSAEMFNTKFGLYYALGASILLGIMSHIISSKDGIDVGIIGLGSIIGGALAPIFIGTLIGFIGSASKSERTKGSLIKQSIFYTALVLGVFLLFSMTTTNSSDRLSSSDDEILEEITQNIYKRSLCKTDCERYTVKLTDLSYQAQMRAIDTDRVLAAINLGEYRAAQEIKKEIED